MNYVDGFVIPVPTANKARFLEHARAMDSLIMDLGALRILECWGDDVPAGETTDFVGAVKAKPDETIVFSWIEWPDKPTRDAAMQKMMDGSLNDDPRMDMEGHKDIFDGKRLIYGGFAPLLKLEQGRTS